MVASDQNFNVQGDLYPRFVYMPPTGKDILHTETMSTVDRYLFRKLLHFLDRGLTM